MITKKKLTKLINADFRRSTLLSMSDAKKTKFKIKPFARYTVDSCIVHRNKEHENDKAWNYGYTPIQCLAACMKDGSIQKRFFEFNSVNHFLKDKDGDTACEVVEAILIEWAKEDKDIVDFDMDRIDAEFAKIEAEYEEAEKLKAREGEVGCKIKELVEPIVNSVQSKPYADAVAIVEKDVRPLLDNLVADKTIVSYEIEYGRNTPTSRERNEFFLDIEYKVTENCEMLILACNVRPPKTEEKSAEAKDESTSVPATES
jgi:hypothetical protein